jgi:hypothetical protein
LKIRRWDALAIIAVFISPPQIVFDPPGPVASVIPSNKCLRRARTDISNFGRYLYEIVSAREEE